MEMKIKTKQTERQTFSTQIPKTLQELCSKMTPRDSVSDLRRTKKSSDIIVKLSKGSARSGVSVELFGGEISDVREW